jgi:isoleucyl-tRNA synthetase
MVIAMDDNITPELKAEWNARDIVRFIQDARKEADYMVDDRINISLEGSIIEDIKDFISYIEWETLSTVKSSLDSFDLEKKVKVDGEEVVIKLKK